MQLNLNVLFSNVYIFCFQVAVLAMISRILPVGALPLQQNAVEDIITGQEFLTLLNSDSSKDHLVYDINKKEAPRINPKGEELLNIHDDVFMNESQNEQTFSRSSRSNKEESRENSLKNEPVAIKDEDISNDDDLNFASSSYYRENENNERLKNGFPPSSIPAQLDEDAPKIIGIRVTSSVAIGRGNKTPQLLVNQQAPVTPNTNIESDKSSKSVHTGNKYTNDSPTTWRPSVFRFLNQEYYKGASSNRHSVSIPGGLMGANTDYIQQQKEREMARNNPGLLHPYQRAIIYQGNSREPQQRPRSFSYSSVINTFGDSKITTANDWISSTKADSVATEATAGYVTIINHGGDNRVDAIKDILDPDVNIKNDNGIKTPNINTPRPNISPLPMIYSEPAKIYSEPAKIYGEPAKIYGKPEEIYSEPAKVYSEPAKNYGEPSKVYGEPAKVYSEPAKVYGEPSKIYSQPSSVYHPIPSMTNQNDNVGSRQHEPGFGLQHQQMPSGTNNNYENTKRLPNFNDTRGLPLSQGRSRGPGEQNYEVDESISVMTNGRTHGVQDKNDDGQKVGYVVEGTNYRKYRVEERTPDGFIVGEYGVVSHDDGSLRGVRYTADSTTNPRLIHDALMKFLSL